LVVHGGIIPTVVLNWGKLKKVIHHFWLGSAGYVELLSGVTWYNMTHLEGEPFMMEFTGLCGISARVFGSGHFHPIETFANVG